MEKSWRHHYLPQFYIKGFCDEDKKITVYNKQYKKFEKKSSKYIFFEKGRNTHRDATGNESDTLEKIYAYLESSITPHLNNVINSSTDKMAIETLRNLIFLAYLTKWRNPQYDSSFNIIKNNFTVDDFGLGLKQDENRVDIELEQFCKSELSQDAKRLLLSIQPFRFKEDYKNIFRNSFIMPSSTPCLLSDCPFVEAGFSEDRYFEDFVFPISLHQRLIFSDRIDKYEFINHFKDNKEKELKFIHLFSTTCDLVAFHYADKYVACADEEYLRKVVEGYETMKQEQLFDVDYLTAQSFNVLYNYKDDI